MNIMNAEKNTLPRQLHIAMIYIKLLKHSIHNTIHPRTFCKVWVFWEGHKIWKKSSAYFWQERRVLKIELEMDTNWKINTLFSKIYKLRKLRNLSFWQNERREKPDISHPDFFYNFVQNSLKKLFPFIFYFFIWVSSKPSGKPGPLQKIKNIEFWVS